MSEDVDRFGMCIYCGDSIHVDKANVEDAYNKMKDHDRICEKNPFIAEIAELKKKLNDTIKIDVESALNENYIHTIKGLLDRLGVKHIQELLPAIEAKDREIESLKKERDELVEVLDRAGQLIGRWTAESASSAEDMIKKTLRQINNTDSLRE